MDYCSACRRYLNGALACAGCGTPAEHLISAAPVAPAPGSAAGFGSDPAALADVYADSLVVLSGERGPGQGRAQGRAAARRRTGHRRRRRTALTVGLGLMLAAGATLGLARLATDGERTDRAATVVLTDEAGPAEPAPLPGLTGDPVAPSGTASAKGPAAGSGKQGGTGRGTGASTVGSSGSPSGAGPSRSASRTPTSAAPTTSRSGGSATPSASASSKGPKGKPSKKPPQEPTEDPTEEPTEEPTPEPTPECDDWWNPLCW